MVEPGAVITSTVVPTPEPGASLEQTRRIVISGEPRLYLQALSELLDSMPGVSASLVPPGDANPSTEEFPDLIVLGSPTGNDGSPEPYQTLLKSYPGVPLVLLDSGSASGGVHWTASLNVVARFSTRLPLDDLVTALCDPTHKFTAGRHHARSGKSHSQWPLSLLSEREVSVLRLVVNGRSNNEAAEALGISRHTVRTHLQNIMAKLLVRSRTELVSVAMRAGIRPGVEPIGRDG